LVCGVYEPLEPAATDELLQFTREVLGPPSKEETMFRFRDPTTDNIYLYPTITHLPPVDNETLDKAGVPLLVMSQEFIDALVK
jgi:hypothetical protein